MWALLGLFAGALLGHALWREWGTILGGFAGFFIGVAIAGARQRDRNRKPAGVDDNRRASATATFGTGDAAISPAAAGPSAVPAEESAAHAAGSFSTTQAPVADSDGGPASRSGLEQLWIWFTGGNAFTRIGVVVLFFGVAFLLRYFAELFTFTIELKLSLVAIGGAALVALGKWLEPKRRDYGISLQAAGAGILYLTTYAAFRIYAVLPDQVAIALLVVIAALTVFLALRSDSQWLAALAIAGGFLAPMLATEYGPPVFLFGYFAVLNAAIFALAWRRSWRALNALGVVCTFGLGLFWGHAYYSPEHFTSVEPFLILFAAFYIVIAILEARRSAAFTSLDGLVVFGAPLIGFTLQVALVNAIPYAAAASAIALALIYGALFLWLKTRTEAGLALLAKCFLVLAFIFATIAAPLAFDDRWMVALWAVEAAGVYWMGVTQRSRVARGFALVVQLAAGVAFILTATEDGSRTVFVNAHFIGAMLIGLSGLTTAFIADRSRETLSPFEREIAPLVFCWGVLWWLLGGATELSAHLSRVSRPHAILAWVTASAGLGLVLWRVVRWPRLAAAGWVLLPVMIGIGWRDFELARTTFTRYGWLVYALAWITHSFVLRAADGRLVDRDAGPITPGLAGALRIAHAGSLLLLTAQLAWEASEWVGRFTPAHTVWMACAAALPVIATLGIVTRFQNSARWPFRVHRDAYAVGVGTPVALLLAAWFVVVNAGSPGDPSPLPYVPLANPLEITLACTLAVVLEWARRCAPIARRTLFAWLGIGLFIGLNGIVFRAAHHWGDIPWDLSSLLASKSLQATLTLGWSAAALVVMFIATRRTLRPLWMVGAVLLAVVVGKLFLIDLGALSGLPRVVAFLGAGVLLLVIGYLSPLPPSNERLEGAGGHVR